MPETHPTHYSLLATKPALLAIVGPTASGKSELALKIAKKFNGEIIAADSRTIYKGMDIGTAKPTKLEQKQVPHWGIDLIEPGETFSAYQFKQYAEEKIKEIQERGNLPILVGGTGLYIDSVLFDFGFVDSKDSNERSRLEALSTAELQVLIKECGYPMPENENNRRHLIRTIERKGKIGAKRSLKNNILIIGINPNSEVLKERISRRIEKIFDAGFVGEVKHLLNKYGEQKLLKSKGIGYGPAIHHLKGNLSLEEAKEEFRRGDWQYARRQRTWFKRNKFIRWFDSPEQAYKEIVRILNN
jgi:tRNA dimethylallyltransferase